ncbi:MAG: hypothetical protein KAS32_06205, partial [Candidatus Peribacteraceae bacterium]|nr:hypothetical protein [Candidatus Peribacteraceae bacterium]
TLEAAKWEKRLQIDSAFDQALTYEVTGQGVTVLVIAPHTIIATEMVYEQAVVDTDDGFKIKDVDGVVVDVPLNKYEAFRALMRVPYVQALKTYMNKIGAIEQAVDIPSVDAITW